MDGEDGRGVWHWMTLPLRRYADFDGRSQRAEYWWYTLFWWLVVIALYAVTFSGFPWGEMLAEPGTAADNTAPPQPSPLIFIGAIGLVLWFLGTLVPTIAVTVRRFHDQDKSGWFYLLNFIPYVGFLIIIVFMCLEGTRGPNSHGDDPRGENTASVFE